MFIRTFFLPLRKLIFPCLFFITAMFFRVEVVALQPVYLKLLDWLPFVILGLACSLSIYYNRSRVCIAILLLLLTYFLIQIYLQTSLNDPYALFIYSGLTILVPVNLLFLLFFPERGLSNRYSLLVIALIPLQLFFSWWLLHYFTANSIAVAIDEFIPVKVFDGYIMSVFASVVFFFTGILGIWKLFKDDSEDTAALLTILLFVFVMFAFFNQMKISVLILSVAGLSLFVSLVRSSYDMAYRDELTGLLGRRALNERLKGLGRRYTIAMVDIDHFKKFNDKYGHDVGDEVLKMVASHINAVKGGGVAYRYGGEEFCIVFAGKSIERCVEFLETIRITIETYRMSIRDVLQRPESSKLGKQSRGKITDNKTVSVTISMGVAERSEALLQPEDVIKVADEALYKAKKAGRNRLVF